MTRYCYSNLFTFTYIVKLIAKWKTRMLVLEQSYEINLVGFSIAATKTEGKSSMQHSVDFPARTLRRL